eukprot:scaffold3043_cov360-Prasinococcus_capsulatus_cf.AAC.16
MPESLDLLDDDVPTDEMPLRSCEHGRQRRRERRITKAMQQVSSPLAPRDAVLPTALSSPRRGGSAESDQAW